MDPLTLRQCQFAGALARLILKAEEIGLQVKICELNRDIETQKRYVAEGKSKTMNSRHLDKLAVDLAIVRDGMIHADGELFRPLGIYWESLGGRWGGRFVDQEAWLAKNGRRFDPATDLGWDSCHFEFRLA